jgi:hypothetical protein
MDIQVALYRAELFIQNDGKAEARPILVDILREDPDNEKAWILSAQVSDVPDEIRYCLQRAIKINPNSLQAKVMLARLQQPRVSLPGQPASKSEQITEPLRPDLPDTQPVEPPTQPPGLNSQIAYPSDPAPKKSAPGPLLSFLRSLIKTIFIADLIMLPGGLTMFETNESLGRFWIDYGLLLVVMHAAFILGFIILRHRIDRLNQRPPYPFNRQKGEKELQNTGHWLRWFATPTLIGILLVSIGVYGYAVIYQHPLPIRNGIFVLVVFSLLLLALLASSMNTLLKDYMLYLRRCLTRSAEEAPGGGQAPVLYLRPFKDDALAGDSDEALLKEEEEMIKAFEPIGPMIAIGNPKQAESLPETGAARAYVDERWKSAVLNYMDMARLVVLRAGISPSLDWEIKTAIKFHRSKLIVLIPFKKKEYDQFREYARKEHLFPKRLPDHPGHTVNYDLGDIDQRKFGCLLGLIYFDADGTGHFEKISMDGIHRLQQIRTAEPKIWMMLHYALRPVYARLGLDWVASKAS